MECIEDMHMVWISVPAFITKQGVKTNIKSLTLNLQKQQTEFNSSVMQNKASLLQW